MDRTARRSGYDIERRCFVLGAPRSGTTLVQSMLAAHSRVVSFPETNYVNAAVGDFARRVLGRPEASVIRTARTRARLALGLATRAAAPRFVRVMRFLGHPELGPLVRGWPIRITHAVNALIQCLDRIALTAGNRIWVEKTPTHFAYLDWLEPACPGARFVHVLRPGSAVVASLFDAARRYPDSFWARDYSALENCVHCWNAARRAADARRHDDAHYFLYLDEVLEDPDAQIRALSEWLGFDFEPQMVSGYAAASAELTLDSEVWKSGVRRPLTQDSKFERLFAPDRQAEILRRLDAGGLPPPP